MLRSVERTILHADLDAFYASVEQRDDPSLRGRPVLVGGGVITAASYEAKARGITTPTNQRAALALCPDAVVVPGRMEAYTEASQRVFEIFHDTSPEVEGLSVDEAFLDVSGLRRIRGTGPEIAARLRARVLDEVGLPISVGVATTKFLAKVASQEAKPNGMCVVEPGTELEFLHPLPLRRLWGVGPKTSARLEAKGLRVVGDVAALDEDRLVNLLGRASGHHLHALAHNRDPRRVETGRRRRSVGSQRSFPARKASRAEAESIVLEVVDGVTRRLRKADRVGRTVVLRLRFGDFTPATRSRTLIEATQSTDPVLAVANELLDEVWPTIEQRGLTRVGIAVTNLGPADTIQLALPFGKRTNGRLDEALDQVAERFGGDAVGRTRLLGRGTWSVPMLPD